MLGAPVFRTALFGPWSGNALWTAARAVPSLDLCFADKKDLICASSGRQLVTFARASSGTYTDSAGVLRTAATDVPRFDHNPLTGESLGLLVEEQRTNLVLRSSEISLSFPWGGQSTTPTVATGAFTAPDGSNTATRVTFAAADSRIIQGNLPVVNGTTYTLSLYARPVTAGTLNKLRLACFDGVNQQNSNDLTLVAGWQRINFTFTSTGTGLASINIRNELSAANANDIYIWGAQLEAGAFASSYIPTTTAAATRNADVPQITGTNFSSWYRQDEGTLYAEGKRDGTADGRFLGLSTGSISNTYVLTTNASRTAIISSVSGGSFGGGVTTANSFAYQNPIKLAASISALLNENICLNGGVVATGSTTTPVGTLTTLDIGTQSGAATAFFNGTIRRLTYWPQRLDNATLQAITQP